MRPHSLPAQRVSLTRRPREKSMSHKIVRCSGTACERTVHLFAVLAVVGHFVTAAQGAAQATLPGLRAGVADTVHLSLAHARERALAANPDLAAARLDTAIARGWLRQASVLRFNPSADALTGGDGLELGLSQEIEVFGQRGLRVSAARAGVARARASVANERRRTLGDVDRSFFGLVAATQRSKLASEILALTERLADVARRQLVEGEISRLEFNLSVIELGRARAREIARRREQQEAGILLSRLIGLSPNSTLLPIFDGSIGRTVTDTATQSAIAADAIADAAAALDVDSLTSVALAQRPDILAQLESVRSAEAEVRLSRREALPNLIARGILEPASNGEGSTLRPGLGVSLPIFNRNQGQTEALRAAALQTELERKALAATVRAEVSRAVSELRAAAAEVAVLQSTVLVPARQNRTLVEIAYREGKVGIAELLLIQNQAMDAELDYWAAWLAGREALATLAEVTAQNIAGTSLPRPQ